MEHCTIFSTQAGRSLVAPTAQHYFEQVLPNYNGSLWTEVKCTGKDAEVRLTDLSADDPHLNALRPQMHALYSSIPTTKPQAKAIVLAAIHDCQTALGVAATPTLAGHRNTLACIFQLARELRGMVLMPTGALYHHDGTLLFDTDGQSNID